MTSDGRPSPLSLEPDGTLLTIVIDDPPDNHVSRVFAAELRALCRDLREDDTYRALIVTGTDEVFSRGTAPAMFEEASGARGNAHAAEAVLDAYRCASALSSLPFPVIVAMEGDVFDQGFELALAADIRVAGEGCSFRFGHLAGGLIPWDGGTQRLSRVVGPAWAADMIMTGRSIDARESESIGLVTRVTRSGGALDAAREIARTILAAGPIAARYAKEAVHTGMDMTLDHGILLETDLTMVLQTTKDRDEGIRSFLERRDPEFRGE
jgi:enoyl-CoA hydratase/carnithine racemase